MELIDLKIPGCPGLHLVMEAGGAGVSRPCLLESYSDVAVYLGAICDLEDQPREWVEIRIQEVSGIETSLDASGRELNGPMLDRRWMRMVDGTAGVDRDFMIRGPWEKQHPAPLYLDPQGTALAADADAWELCTDDALLEKHRLATFSGSWHRYLVAVSGEPKFVPLTASAPRSPATVEIDDVFAGLQPINPEAGLMMIRRVPGLKYGDFIDFLGGKDFGDDPGRLLRVPPVGAYKAFTEKNAYGQAGAGFIHGKSSVSERLAEVLFLKLSLLRGAFEAIATAVGTQKLPYLSISSDSFGVSLAQPAPALPFLWNHRVSLCAVSSVVPLPLGHSGKEQIFVPCTTISGSIYRAPRISAPVRGKGRVRIRKVTPPDDGGFSVVEGTLQTDESLEVSRKDLLEMDLRLPKGRRFTIHANFVSAKSGEGENRFLSLPIALPPDLFDEPEEDGLQFSERTEFQIIPSLGPTADLFSMGVVAVRTLLGGVVPLAETVDDLWALMRAYGRTFEANEWDTGSGKLETFVRSEKGKEWAGKFKVSRLGEGVSDEDASLAIPDRLWWQVIEFAGRLFPGEMPGSFARDFDDFDVRVPEAVFREPIAALDGLIENCRSLLFGNPVASREILTVIRDLATKSN